MTRVPSIGFLFALMAAQETNATSVSKTGVRDENIYYVLNPDKNLAKTHHSDDNIELKAGETPMELGGINNMNG